MFHCELNSQKWENVSQFMSNYQIKYDNWVPGADQGFVKQKVFSLLGAHSKNIILLIHLHNYQPYQVFQMQQGFPARK